MNKALSLLSTLAFAVPLGVNAQIVNIPMQPSANGTLEETISGKSLAINTALAPYSIAGAKG